MAFYPPIIGSSLSEFLASKEPLTKLIGEFVLDAIMKERDVYSEIARIDPSRLHISHQDVDGRFHITVQCAYSDLDNKIFEGLLSDLRP